MPDDTFRWHGVFSSIPPAALGLEPELGFTLSPAWLFLPVAPEARNPDGLLSPLCSSCSPRWILCLESPPVALTAAASFLPLTPTIPSGFTQNPRADQPWPIRALHLLRSGAGSAWTRVRLVRCALGQKREPNAGFLWAAGQASPSKELRNAVNTYRADTGEDERLSHVDVGVLWVHVLSCQIVQA